MLPEHKLPNFEDNFIDNCTISMNGKNIKTVVNLISASLFLVAIIFS